MPFAISKNRKPNRLKGYDYSREGLYFITICTKDRLPYFGKIENGILNLNHAGEIAKECLNAVPRHFVHSRIMEYVIMPNHVHAIIKIEYPDGQTATVQETNNRTKMYLSRIVQQYKATVSKEIHEISNEIFFQWQKSYYDHIIRDEKSYWRIWHYIRNNPKNWKYDLENENKINETEKK